MAATPGQKQNWLVGALKEIRLLITDLYKLSFEREKYRTEHKTSVKPEPPVLIARQEPLALPPGPAGKHSAVEPDSDEETSPAE